MNFMLLILIIGVLNSEISFLDSQNVINELEKKWIDFKIQFRKQYESFVDEKLHFMNFVDNLLTNEEHNEKYDMGLVSYKKGVNQFSDLSFKEFSDLLLHSDNEMHLKSSKTAIKFVDIFNNSTSIPDSIDWREKGGVSPIKNQQQCGSCWAFSTNAAIESHYLLKKGESVFLSEQELIDCDFENFGCSGGNKITGFDYIKSQGISSQTDYPYKAVEDYCKAEELTKIATITGHVEIKSNDENELKNAVGSIGPVAVSIYVTKDFKEYQSGIFVDDLCPSFETNHAVLAVGYGSENGIDYWIIKNSWGTSFGENGFIRMARNRNNMCAIALTPSYPLV